MLFIERDGHERAYTPLVSCTGGAPVAGADGWLWRAAFAVSLDLETARRGSFVLSLRDDLLLALPGPETTKFGQLQDRRPDRKWHGWPYAVRRTALLFVVSCQLGLAPSLSPVAAFADAASGAPGEGPPEAPPQPTNQGTGEPGPQAPPEQPLGNPGEPPPETPAPHASGEPAQPGPEPPPTPAGAPSGPPADQPKPMPPVSVPDTDEGVVTASLRIPAVAASPSPADVRSQKSHSARPARGSHPEQSARLYPGRGRGHSEDPRRSRPTRPTPTVATPPTLAPTELPTFPAGLSADLLGAGEETPPAYLIPIYKEAGHRYHVPWRVLAAINAIETDYGRNLSVSSAGALGWMQFMPETWRQWGVDADGDGHLNPYSPQDAIFSAARYLHASGASRDLSGAIFAYNHADWYVTEVLLRARLLGNVATFARVEKGYSLPLDARYMQPLGRTDDGVDIETAPDGSLVYSITPGIVSAVASDPAGFGPSYPVIEATSGSLAGQHIYYGHVAQSLVEPGQPVHAGQPIAIVGHTGDAASLGHGHIEIGFSDAGGDPLSHHGAEAWTPAGDVMRSFLSALSSDFALHAGP
jgi:murein DD-endopeptidase MepM/ murein hydrolase activator NlpD